MSSVSAVPESKQMPAKGRRRFTVDALFTDHRPQAVGVEDLPTAKEIRLERIEADPQQPRRTFDPDRLEELTASIRREGVLQPIAVRYDADRDVYVVVHGERRLRAARQAGLVAIPAIVREVPHDRRLVQQLMENIVRDDISGGRLSEKQSRALQGLPSGHQEALHDAIIRHELSAEEAMRTARALKRAGLADDMKIASAFIDALRSEQNDAAGEGDALSRAAGLFAAIEAAAAGERGSADALAAAARTAKAPAFDGDRLRAEVLALARTLARTPTDELLPGGAAYMPLSMLRGTLDILLPA